MDCSMVADKHNDVIAMGCSMVEAEHNNIPHPHLQPKYLVLLQGLNSRFVSCS